MLKTIEGPLLCQFEHLGNDMDVDGAILIRKAAWQLGLVALQSTLFEQPLPLMLKDVAEPDKVI